MQTYLIGIKTYKSLIHLRAAGNKLLTCENRERSRGMNLGEAKPNFIKGNVQ